MLRYVFERLAELEDGIWAQIVARVVRLSKAWVARGFLKVSPRAFDMVETW